MQQKILGWAAAVRRIAGEMLWESASRASKREGALLSQASLLFRCKCSVHSDESAPVGLFEGSAFLLFDGLLLFFLPFSVTDNIKNYISNDGLRKS